MSANLERYIKLRDTSKQVYVAVCEELDRYAEMGEVRIGDFDDRGDGTWKCVLVVTFAYMRIKCVSGEDWTHAACLLSVEVVVRDDETRLIKVGAKCYAPIHGMEEAGDTYTQSTWANYAYFTAECDAREAVDLTLGFIGKFVSVLNANAFCNAVEVASCER